MQLFHWWGGHILGSLPGPIFAILLFNVVIFVGVIIIPPGTPLDAGRSNRSRLRCLLISIATIMSLIKLFWFLLPRLSERIQLLSNFNSPSSTTSKASSSPCSSSSSVRMPLSCGRTFSPVESTNHCSPITTIHQLLQQTCQGTSQQWPRAPHCLGLAVEVPPCDPIWCSLTPMPCLVLRGMTSTLHHLFSLNNLNSHPPVYTKPRLKSLERTMETFLPTHPCLVWCWQTRYPPPPCVIIQARADIHLRTVQPQPANASLNSYFHLQTVATAKTHQMGIFLPTPSIVPEPTDSVGLLGETECELPKSGAHPLP